MIFQSSFNDIRDILVKRLLRQYGYPPDMELLATENVLKQAELLADDWIGEQPWKTFLIPCETKIRENLLNPRLNKRRMP